MLNPRQDQLWWGFPGTPRAPPGTALPLRGPGREGRREGTVRAERSLSRTALSSNHTLGRLTYLINLFRDKPNQMQAIYLPKHQFAG